MIIGIIGSGGREHAICAKILESKKVKKLYCFPGNAGTNLIATNVNIEIDDFEKIKNFVIKNKIDYLVVGPEKPLVDGIVDYFEKYNIKIFGPNKIAAQLEGSKIFTKKICEKYKIPTAKFGIFNKSKEAISFISHHIYHPKLSGLFSFNFNWFINKLMLYFIPNLFNKCINFISLYSYFFVIILKLFFQHFQIFKTVFSNLQQAFNFFVIGVGNRYNSINNSFSLSY